VLSNRKLLALLLKKRGLQSVTFAEDGRAAIEAVEAVGVDYFDIIFMDNTMPVMVGIFYPLLPYFTKYYILPYVLPLFTALYLSPNA